MKEIKLVPGHPFYNYVEVTVIDFPKGREEGTERTRCKVTVDFSRYDVEQLKKQGLDLAGAMKHYEEDLYQMVRARLAMEWTCVEGMEETMAIVEENVARFY